MEITENKDKYIVGVRYTDLDTLLRRKDIIVNTIKNTIKREKLEGKSSRELEDYSIVFSKDGGFILKMNIVNK